MQTPQTVEAPKVRVPLQTGVAKYIRDVQSEIAGMDAVITTRKQDSTRLIESLLRDAGHGSLDQFAAVSIADIANGQTVLELTPHPQQIPSTPARPTPVQE
jgi:hypothetical protein